jgi:hypothetical protein
VSDYALTGTVLTRDLHDAAGKLVASRGEIVDLGRLKRACQRAPREARQRPLHETAVSTAVLEAFDAPALSHVVEGDARAQVADTLCEVRFPDPVWAELDVLRRDDPARYQHAIWTAIVSTRLFRAALGEAPGLSRLAGGALVHDLGMRYASPRLRSKRDFLTQSEALLLEEHPFVGALLLASAMGESPAVHFALLHHTRSGRGYPRIDGTPPLRGLDLVAVASAFAALTQARPFRSAPYDARGAVDLLVAEAKAGRATTRTLFRNGRSIRIVDQPMQSGGWVATFEDITEQREREEQLARTEQALREANRQKNEFLAIMSHELRTPLTSILGYTDMLLRGLGGPLNMKTGRYVSNVRTAGDRLLELVNGLLDFTRLEAGREQIEVRPIGLLDEVRAAVERFPFHAALKAVAAARGVPLREDVRAPLRRLRGEERAALETWLESSSPAPAR